MGIHGIYKEIGAGERIALSKLAVQKFEETGRPLRLAIDCEIWLFQIQSGRGGTNPALRTFYYRLLRLISLSIHPLFVFDGPNKPPFKRNRRTGGPGVASIPEFLAKQLLKHFGLPFHLAPGEAEAECALLQREGIVDAVMSEDVDTLMFGSGVTLRNWSPNNDHSGPPTHVNLYNAEKTKRGPSGLDRDGMILIALMSGGDYIPEGIPGCGPKTACEAARAGFGRDLCKIPKRDTEAFRSWKEKLVHELRTNESKHFKRKHTALKIPDDFPRVDILGYYTKPAISGSEALQTLRDSLVWDQDIDFASLRDFTRDAFDWCKLGGAKKFIRNLAPALLVRELRLRGQNDGSADDGVDAVQRRESELVDGIHGLRTHASTDATTELRISFTAVNVVAIDLTAEPPDDVLSDEGSDSEADGDAADGEGDGQRKKKRATMAYDPTQPEKLWILETYVKVGVPLMVQDWEDGLRNPKKRAPAKSRSRASAPKGKRSSGKANSPDRGNTVNAFAKVTKSVSNQPSCVGPESDSCIMEIDLSGVLGAPKPYSHTKARPQSAMIESISLNRPKALESSAQDPIELLSSSPPRPVHVDISPTKSVPNFSSRHKSPFRRAETDTRIFAAAAAISMQSASRPKTPPPDLSSSKLQEPSSLPSASELFPSRRKLLDLPRTNQSILQRTPQKKKKNSPSDDVFSSPSHHNITYYFSPSRRLQDPEVISVDLTLDSPLRQSKSTTTMSFREARLPAPSEGISKLAEARTNTSSQCSTSSLQEVSTNLRSIISSNEHMKILEKSNSEVQMKNTVSSSQFTIPPSVSVQKHQISPLAPPSKKQHIRTKEAMSRALDIKETDRANTTTSQKRQSTFRLSQVSIMDLTGDD